MHDSRHLITSHWGFPGGTVSTVVGPAVLFLFWLFPKIGAAGIPGCQVKMLTGRRCAALYSPTMLDLGQAKARLETGFAFVGLTDHYDLSVCLFHAMFGGA